MEKQRDLSDPITLRLPRDVLGEIERIAEACERSRSWVMVRALKAYLAAEGREILDIAKAQAGMDAGLGEDIDDVIRDIDAIVKGKAA